MSSSGIFSLGSSALLPILAAFVLPVQAQVSDRPDLEGTWTNASLTNLQRPAYAETLVVSPEEARVIAARTPIAGIEGGLDEGDGVNELPEQGADDFGVRAYNNFWVDPGSNLALVKGEYRTSYIVNPENGRVPWLDNPRFDFERASFRRLAMLPESRISAAPKHSRIPNVA